MRHACTQLGVRAAAIQALVPPAPLTSNLTRPTAACAGTPAVPRVTNPVGGASGATLGLTAVPTAVKYIVTASRDGTALQTSRHEGAGLGVDGHAEGDTGCPHSLLSDSIATVWARLPGCPRAVCPTTTNLWAPSAPASALPACRTVTDPSAQQVWALAADLEGTPGEYTFSVVAENTNGAQSEAATTPKLVVGTPGAPAWATNNPVVAAAGTATLSWTAPEYNAKIGTRYFVQLYRGADSSATFGSPLALTPAAGGNGTDAAPFTATISVSAGSWSYQLLTSNVWGAGQPSGLFCLPHGVGYQLLSALVCWAMAKGYHWCCFPNSVHFCRAIAYILNLRIRFVYFCPL